jgi:hypothetical protein
MKTLIWLVVAILLVGAGVAGKWFGVVFLAPYAGVLLAVGLIALCILGCSKGCPCCVTVR